MEVPSRNCRFEFCTFAQQVCPASLQPRVLEIVVCSPAVAVHDTRIVLAENLLKDVVASAFPDYEQLIGIRTEYPDLPVLAEHAKACLVDI